MESVLEEKETVIHETSSLKLVPAYLNLIVYFTIQFHTFLMRLLGE